MPAPALDPMKRLLKPVVKFLPEKGPIQTLPTAVVPVPQALYPIAVFCPPDVILPNAPEPIAVFCIDVVCATCFGNAFNPIAMDAPSTLSGGYLTAFGCAVLAVCPASWSISAKAGKASSTSSQSILFI